MSDCSGEMRQTPRRRLEKRDKLTLKADFDDVRLHGRSAAGPFLVAAAAPSADDHPRAGVICGKKYCLLAVDRNRARRLVWESFRLLKTSIAPCHLVFIPRQRMKKAQCAEVMSDMERQLRKLGVWSAAD